MPCMKCSNGKYKYGEGGSCVYDTLAKCNAAAAAINIGDKAQSTEPMYGDVYQPVTKPSQINVARKKN